MDFLPTQDVKYEAYGQMTISGPPSTHIRVVYEDWEGQTQERTVGQGTWPLKSTKLLGYKSVDLAGGTWSALLPLSELGTSIEISVGKSPSQDLPRQLRRGR